MIRRFLGGVALVTLLFSPAPLLAQELVKISYNTLGMLQSLDGSIVDVNSDSTNRVWAVAPGSASAVLGIQRAPLFPIRVGDTRLPVGASFSGLTFSVPQGNAADGEFFYLGSTLGIAWGRFTSTVEHRDALIVDGAPLLNIVHEVDAGAPFGQPDSATDDWLWSATDGGLVQWDLTAEDPNTGLQPNRDVYFDGITDNKTDGPVTSVVAAPWGEAVAVVSSLNDAGPRNRLYVVDPSTRTFFALAYLGNNPGTQLPSRPAGMSTGEFLGLTFDVQGNLWAITSAKDLSPGTNPLILKFEVDNSTTPPTLNPLPKAFPLNPFFATGSGAPAGFLPTDIALNPFSNRVFVTTRSDNQGAMNTAYEQDPIDASGDLNDDPTANAWDTITSTFDRFTTVYADSSGNAWYGMAGTSGASEALNGFILRLLTLDQSRYLGETGARATLVDLVLFGDNGAPEEQTTLNIAVGSDDRPFTVTEEGDTGRFVQVFFFSLSASSQNNVFEVSSSVDDVPVLAAYAFDDSLGNPQQLEAKATWANIVPFEDDLIIGEKCFLRCLTW